MTYLLIVALFAALLAYRERAHDEERSRLLDRIQAPEKAQIVEVPDVGKQHVTVDSDEEWWTADAEARNGNVS